MRCIAFRVSALRLLRDHRALCLVTLAVILSTCGCGGGSSSPNPTPSDYQVVAFSDLHFNPLYDPSLYSKLVASDPSQWAGIYQGSNITAPSRWGEDPNYPLFKLAMSAVAQQAVDSKLVVYTGDMLGHGLPEIFYALYYGKLDHPEPDQQAINAMQTFVDKTVTFVTSQIRASAGDLPVVFAVGNIDSYSSNGPDTAFLANNWSTYYTQMLNSTVDQQTFKSSFIDGGYYSAQPMGATLRIISLNTNNLAPGAPQAPDTELQWLDSQLTAAEFAGQQVWLLMHVPPGVNTQQTASSAAAAGAPANVTNETTSMMWVADYQKRFFDILAAHPDVVVLSLGAHTHMDEFRLMSAGSVVSIVPGLSPIFGNNPGFRVFRFPGNSFVPVDYNSFYCDLANAPAGFSNLYLFSAAYGLSGSMNSSWIQLSNNLDGDSSTQSTFLYFYDMANSTIDPHTHASWNPANHQNWPIFACGISEMKEQEYIDCVNGY